MDCWHRSRSHTFLLMSVTVGSSGTSQVPDIFPANIHLRACHFSA